jgi:hypothetical protein
MFAIEFLLSPIPCPLISAVALSSCPSVWISIGDSFSNNNSNNVTAAQKDTFLPDQTTRDLAVQANTCLQEAVQNDGAAYVQHLDGFIVALREELDAPGGFVASRNSQASYRTP